MKKLKESSEYIVTVYTKKDDSKLIGGYKDKDTAIKIGRAFIKENLDYVEFEVDLYDGYNSETVYKEEDSKSMKKIIEIQKEVKIGSVILEKGDKIEVLGKNKWHERYSDNDYINALERLYDILEDSNDHTGASLMWSIFQDRNPEKTKKLFDIWYKREKQGFL